MAKRLYIFDENKVPVPEEDGAKWGEWFNSTDRTVNYTRLPDGVKISTIFHGMNSALNDGIPLVFETMVFGGEYDGYKKRYATWQEAEAGHLEIIEMIFRV